MTFPEECINFAGYKCKQGYGRIRAGGKVRLAHRVAYAEANGVDLNSLSGVLIRHRCDNPSCINPKHLEVGSHQDNMDDMNSRGRHAGMKGGNNVNARLTATDVEEIRRLHVRKHKEFSARALSKRYGVSETHIGRIVSGKNWDATKEQA